MKNTIKPNFAIALLFGALALIPISARADKCVDRDAARYVVNSFVEHFSGPTSLDGTAVLAGVINDKGTRHEDFTIIGANNDGTQIYITGTGTDFLSQGNVTFQFTATIHITSPAMKLGYVEGSLSITGGTGAYASSRGRGSFALTVDQDTNELVGADEAILLP